MKLLALALLAAASISAGGYRQLTFTELDAVETSNTIDIREFGQPSESMVFHAVVAGGPATCTLNIFGSVDGVNFIDISGNKTCTSGVVFGLVNTPVTHIQARLTALSGGTTPTVNVKGLIKWQ